MERSLLLPLPMSDERSVPQPDERHEKGAMEEDMQKIDAIVGDEVLGYEGTAHGEHSGQDSSNDERSDGNLEDRLADNRPDQMK